MNSLLWLGNDIYGMDSNMLLFPREKEAFRHSAQAAEAKIAYLEAKLTRTQFMVNSLRALLIKQINLSQRDRLTGLLNRKGYDEQIQNLYARWQRHQDGLVLIIADIDNFKSINDAFGHLAGDKVLKKIATILKESFRKYDTVARFGGEEFVIVIEKSSITDGKNIAEKVRKLIEKSHLRVRNVPLTATVSFGLAEFNASDTIEDVFGRADAALYKAKINGRNQVMVL